MKHLKVGHKSDPSKSTGVTVFLFNDGKPCAMHLCGSAPGARETLNLQGDTIIEGVHGLMLTGGSAFGLPASAGVMQYLKEKDIGFKTPHACVPIVPAAVIYDLGYQEQAHPTPELVYEACQVASEDNTVTGSIGVGTGATVGKLIPDAKPQKSGLGYCKMTVGDLEVCAYVAVNALGDVYNEQGEIIAGATKEGVFQNCSEYCLSKRPMNSLKQQNTTLASVFTNAKLDQPALKRVARAASAGFARAIKPVFTLYDGDIVFATSLGELQADELVVGELAAKTITQAIVSLFENMPV